MKRLSIPFHVPYLSGNEQAWVADAIRRGSFAGDGYFTHACEAALREITTAQEVLLTSSCTHALEMCALLLDLQPGDEVIMSAFNFVSAANAFVLRGAKIVFVDIDPLSMNLDADLIEAAISPRTKAILVMHYGGVACDMDKVMAIARRYALKVIEDAAHCIGAYYQGKHLGSIGDLGTLSFHATKNIHCGEGGALMINNPELLERAHIIREKGTNRRAFLTGKVDKYSWVDIGSSYLMSELSAAFLYGQLQDLPTVNRLRRQLWDRYQQAFELGTRAKAITADSNGHIVYLRCASTEARNSLMLNLANQGIGAHFHYVPLHTSLAGRLHSRFDGEDVHTTALAGRLLRLPIYPTLSMEAVNKILDSIEAHQIQHL